MSSRNNDQSEYLSDEELYLPDKNEYLYDKGEYLPEEGDYLPEEGEYLIEDRGEYLQDEDTDYEYFEEYYDPRYLGLEVSQPDNPTYPKQQKLINRNYKARTEEKIYTGYYEGLIHRILLNSDYDTIKNQCRLNQYINKLCKDTQFWSLRIQNIKDTDELYDFLSKAFDDENMLLLSIIINSMGSFPSKNINEIIKQLKVKNKITQRRMEKIEKFDDTASKYLWNRLHDLDLAYRDTIETRLPNTYKNRITYDITIKYFLKR